MMTTQDSGIVTIMIILVLLSSFAGMTSAEILKIMSQLFAKYCL